MLYRDVPGRTVADSGAAQVLDRAAHEAPARWLLVASRMLRALLPILIIAWSVPALAEPTPISLSTKMSYRGYAAVAGSPSGALVTWEQIAPSGPDDRPREIYGAVVGEGGKLVVAPVKLLDGGLAANHLQAIWNGTSFTLAICSEDQRKLVWGTVSADGKFAKQGEQTVTGRGTLFCNAISAQGGKVGVVATDKDEQYGANDRLLSRKCTSTRYDISGTKAIAGKPMKLCEVYGADAGWAIGSDPKEKDQIVTGAGKLVASPPLYVGQQYAVSFGGKPLVRLRATRGTILMGVLDASFKKPTKIKLDKTPIDADGNTIILALPNDRFALIQGAYEPTRHTNVAVFNVAGKAAGALALGDDKHAFGLCAPLATSSLACVAVGDDVQAIVVPLP